MFFFVYYYLVFFKHVIFYLYFYNYSDAIISKLKSTKGRKLNKANATIFKKVDSSSKFLTEGTKGVIFGINKATINIGKAIGSKCKPVITGE